MRRVYQATALAFLGLAVFVVLESRDLSLYSDLGPGPGFFPFWLGMLLTALCITWLIQVSFGPVPPIERGFLPDRPGVVRIFSIMGALVTLTASLEAVGFRVATLVFLIFLLSTLGRQHPGLTVILALMGSFGLYHVFGTWLEIQLPDADVDVLRNLGL